MTVSVDGVARPITGARRRALLARLLIAAGDVVARDTLVHDLWGERPPLNPANALQAYLSHLRQVLDGGRAGRHGSPILVTRKPGYAIDVDEDHLDARRFELLAHRGRHQQSGDPAAAAATLAEGLALWAGPALAEFSAEPWAAAEVARLEELRACAVEDRFDAELALGNHAPVVAELESACAEAPLRERRRAQLLVALHRSGRQPEALRAYQQFRRLLGDELGLEPGAALRQLDQRIAAQDPGLEWSPAPAGPATGQLPTALTSFIGREDDLARVPELLERQRVVAVVGLGGGGKTRLALEVGRRIADRFPDGVWFVELAPVVADDRVADAVADCVRVQPGSVSIERSLADWFRGRDALVVLDNCEHVLEGVERVVSFLVQRAPGLRVLATSRAPLRLPGVTLVRLRPLRIPPEGEEATRLFADRAAAVHGAWAPQEADAAAVVEICHRLDGNALAIELAAAATTTMPVAGVLRHIEEQHLVLAGGAAGTGRHRSLESALGWSVELLEPEHRLLLGRLASFAGRFSDEAAEDLVVDATGSGRAAVASGLAALVRASLIAYEPGAGDRPYRLPEPVRVYARRHLAGAGSPSVEEAHLAWVARLAEAARSEIKGPRQGKILHELDGWSDDVRAALALAVEKGRAPATGLDIAVALTRWWSVRGRAAEGRQWVEAAVRGLEQRAELGLTQRKAAVDALRTLLIDEALLPEAEAVAEELIELGHSTDDEAAVSSGLALLAGVALIRSDYPSAERYADEALRSRRALEACGRLHIPLTTKATAYRYLARYSDAAPLFDEALTAARTTGDVVFITNILYHRAVLRHEIGEPAGAQTDLEEALAASRSIGFRQSEALSMGFLGTMRAALGDLAGAAALLEESVELARRIADPQVLLMFLASLGGVNRRLGDLVAARRHLGEALLVARRVGEELYVGATMTGLADVALAEGDRQAARELYRDGLAVAVRVGDRRGIVQALEASAALLEAEGQAAEATRQLAASERHRQELTMPPEPAQAEALAALLERCRLRLGAHFTVAYGAGRALDLDAAIRQALAALGEPPTPQDAPAGAGGDSVSIHTLGPLRIRRGTVQVEVRSTLGDDAADLLALLAVHRGPPVTRDAAGTALWPGQADDRQRLSRTISVLRAALDPDRRHEPSWFLATAAEEMWLNCDHVDVDVDRILAAAHDGLALHRSAEHDAAAARLLTALGGPSADLLTDRPIAPWAQSLRRTVREALADAARALVAIAQTKGDPDAVAAFARMVVERDRFDEDAHLALIEALRATGRHEEMLRAHADYAGVMQQLGLHPVPAPVPVGA